MNYKLHSVLLALAVLLATFVASLSVWAQSAPSISITDQLKAQYKITKLGQDSFGVSVLEAGTVLVIQKGGILGVPQATSLIVPTTTYRDGELHSPSAGARMFLGNDTRLFQVGEKVYILRLDINVKAERVSLQILGGPYVSQVVFQYPKGYIEAGSISEIAETIGKVFTIKDGAQQQPQVAQSMQVETANQQPQGPGTPHNSSATVSQNSQGTMLIERRKEVTNPDSPGVGAGQESGVPSAQDVRSTDATIGQYQVINGQLDSDGTPTTPARLCIGSSGIQSCYTPPTNTKVGTSVLPPFGLNGKAKDVTLADGSSLILFTAESSSGGSGSLTIITLLDNRGGRLENLLPNVEITNAAEYRVWNLPTISTMPILTTADFVWAAGETHFANHRYQIASYVYDKQTGHYVQRGKYVTSKKYPSLDDVDTIAVLDPERATIIARLQ